MKIYQPHKAALAFPPLKPEQMTELKESILRNGQVHPAVLFEGKLLDGRNRQEAIRQLVAEKRLPASTKLRVAMFDRGASLPGFVKAVNIDRRHLTSSQRAMVATKLLPFFRAESKEKQRAAAAATNRKKKSGQKSLTLTAPGPRAKDAADRAAEAAGGDVSGRAVRRAEFVKTADAKLADAVFRDEITLKAAEKRIRLREAKAKVKEYKLPTGRYDVIAGDPPWKFDDELNGSMNRGLDYPTMTVDQICDMKVGERLASPDSVLFLWTTKSHLLDGSASRVIDAWGFESKSMITWVKSNIGLGRYVRNRCEFVIIATRGNPIFDLSGDTALKDDVIVQSGPRLKHSEKPAEAYARFESLVPCGDGRRLELFARAPRNGWVTSGSELAPEIPSGEPVEATPPPAQVQSSVDPVAAPRPSVSPSLSSLGGAGTIAVDRLQAAEEASGKLRIVGDDLPF